MSKIKRIVIDTNILLDIVYFHDIHISQIKDDIEKKDLEFWTCPAIWEEFVDVMHRPYFFTTEDTFMTAQNWVLANCHFENDAIAKSNIKCQDPDDQIFIDLALLKAPCLLVSKDLEVLKLRHRLEAFGVTVFNPLDKMPSIK